MPPNRTTKMVQNPQKSEKGRPQNAPTVKTCKKHQNHDNFNTFVAWFSHVFSIEILSFFCIASMTSQLQKCHLDSLFAMFAACRLFCRNIKKSKSSFIFWKLFVQISHHILQRPRPPKNEAKCLLKWSLWVPKISKNQENSALKKHKKHNTQKIGFGMENDLIWGGPFRFPSPFRITKVCKILKIGLRTSKITKNLNFDFQKSSKIIISTSQNLENPTANCLLFAFYKKTKKWEVWLQTACFCKPPFLQRMVPYILILKKIDNKKAERKEKGTVAGYARSALDISVPQGFW